jgi:hypothetical protein
VVATFSKTTETLAVEGGAAPLLNFDATLQEGGQDAAATVQPLAEAPGSVVQPFSDPVESALEPLGIISPSGTGPIAGPASTVDPLTDPVTSTVETATAPVTSVAEPVVDTATSAVEQVTTPATSAVEPVAEATSAVEPVVDAAGATVERTVEETTSAPGPVGSPTADEQIESAVGAVVEPTGDTTAPVVDAVPPIVEGAAPGGEMIHPAAIDLEPVVPETAIPIPDPPLPGMGDTPAVFTPVGPDAPALPELADETFWSGPFADAVLGVGLTDLQIALGTTGLVAAGALAIARAASSPTTSTLVSNVRLFPGYAHATIQSTRAAISSAPRLGRNLADLRQLVPAPSDAAALQPRTSAVLGTAASPLQSTTWRIQQADDLLLRIFGALLAAISAVVASIGAARYEEREGRLRRYRRRLHS